jgi:hypothetical protein
MIYGGDFELWIPISIGMDIWRVLIKQIVSLKDQGKGNKFNYISRLNPS